MTTINSLENKQQEYIQTLIDSEMSKNTIRQYKLAIKHFIEYAKSTNKCDKIKKDCLLSFKEHLKTKYKPTTANLYIIGLNGYLRYLKQDALCVKTLKIQAQNIFENCLTLDEYNKMLEIAKKQKNNDVYYVMRALASTGMRIYGLRYFTVENIKIGSCTALNKGKVRCIVIPANICKLLSEYCNEKRITTGYIFHSKNPQKLIHETTVLRWLKKVAVLAEIDPDKAFPHNLRHLFARVYLAANNNNIGELADLLGHTALETTRIYIRSSIEEKRKNLELLGL